MLCLNLKHIVLFSICSAATTQHMHKSRTKGGEYRAREVPLIAIMHLFGSLNKFVGSKHTSTHTLFHTYTHPHAHTQVMMQARTVSTYYVEVIVLNSEAGIEEKSFRLSLRTD